MRSVTAILMIVCGVAWAEPARWVERFRYAPVESVVEGVAAPVAGAGMPSFTATPPEAGGRALVRVSLPFAAGVMPADAGVQVRAGDDVVRCDYRRLTYYPGTPRWVRRGLVTFAYDFGSAGARTFAVEFAPGGKQAGPVAAVTETGQFSLGALSVQMTAEGVRVSEAGGAAWEARLVAPNRMRGDAVVEVVEAGAHYVWARLLAADEAWPRIIDVRADSLGTVTVQAQVQRLLKDDGVAPELGWMVTGLAVAPMEHGFGGGEAMAVDTADGAHVICFPDAHLLRRGSVLAGPEGVRYIRCTAEDAVPMQEAAWRRATVAVGPKVGRVAVTVAPEAWDAVYGCGVGADLSLHPAIGALAQYTRDAIAGSMLFGDDYGNVTAFSPGAPAPVYGMNRLNHCPAIFREFWRTGDARLRDTALAWCANMYDLSIWWGDADDVGGTRYNNVSAMGGKKHEGDANFMWRSNEAVHFCTKGFDSFLLAYEETGEPCMAAALRAQVAYAKRYMHVDQGECRNIGDVADFLTLYRLTGDGLEDALRLFAELRNKLGEDNLFSQGGQAIVSDGPFIDDDKHGYDAPFAKPYIIGYALAGLPGLSALRPDEPRLCGVVRAVADFLAAAQDPTGGWRYPHPASSGVIISQGMEHAAQLARAAGALEARGEDIDALLDAIECTLQSRVTGYMRTGAILAGLSGWEMRPGVLAEGQTIYDLYKKPADRDKSRDYVEGAVSAGGAPPEGLVYFPEVLAFYLAHRPAERLYHMNPQLKAVLERLPEDAGAARWKELQGPQGAPLPHAVSQDLPLFRDARVAGMTFPLAYGQARMPFGEWRAKARAAYLAALGPRPPLAPFNVVEEAVEERDGYVARKLVLNLSADARVRAYLLTPKGTRPFPAIVALHDHGAHFSIGKEKVIKPFGVDKACADDAAEWVEKCYGGRYIGDELARRGYVVFAADALYWGERGRKEGVSYEGQQALASNLIQLGYSWAGLITWDDVRGAEFVQGLADVDPDRIGCLGLSMGAHRTWSLCAATDVIKCGAAICWLGDTQALTSPGNNQTRGQSAFSMILPGIRNSLDYADVASLACPKPMLFYNGLQDGLFPVDGVERAYGKMRAVWASQVADERLVTKLWDVPHEFNKDMQAEAFAWLDAQLKD